MKDEYLAAMMRLAQEAGEIALRYREDSEPAFKPDRSVITKADREISRLSQKILGEFLARPGHILVDEESEERGRFLDEKLLAATPYIFAIDPIDGTRGYANRMPGFGVSIGLLKDLKPWLGVVYFPVLGELFFCDGRDSFFVQNAFTDEEVTTRIVPLDQTINKQAIFLLPDSYFNRFDWDFTDLHIMIPACAVVDLCWPAIGRGCGSMIKSYLWDFVGSWPIVRSAGLELRALSTGQVLEKISADLFIGEDSPWKLKEYYVLSSERNFPILKKKIKLKQK